MAMLSMNSGSSSYSLHNSEYARADNSISCIKTNNHIDMNFLATLVYEHVCKFSYCKEQYSSRSYP